MSIELCHKKSSGPIISEDVVKKINDHSSYAKSFSDFYGSERVQKFYSTVKKLPYLKTFDCVSAMKALVSLDEKSNFNAVEYLETKTLSKNNRVAIRRVADVFLGLSIQCLDLSDIQEVTLYGSAIQNESNDPNELFNPDAKIIYLPIKTITQFDSNFVSFFDAPIFIAAEPYTGLSVEVKFKDNLTRPNHFYHGAHVLLHHLYLSTDIRRTMQLDYCRFSSQ